LSEALTAALQAVEKMAEEQEESIKEPEMVPIQGGTFVMGSDDSEYENEKPAHEVQVDSFEAGKYPVTFEEYDQFCEDTGREKPNDMNWGRGKRPAINVSWYDATAYCKWLNEKLGLSEENGYRLLTEEEWEYAYRAGTEGEYPFPLEDIDQYAWYYNNSSNQTHPVGEKLPNPWGLYDMAGNVWEWTASPYKKYGNKP
jgi:formylglycine-generating enzyme required for sulfatase activity